MSLRFLASAPTTLALAFFLDQAERATFLPNVGGQGAGENHSVRLSQKFPNQKPRKPDALQLHPYGKKREPSDPQSGLLPREPIIPDDLTTVQEIAEPLATSSASVRRIVEKGLSIIHVEKSISRKGAKTQRNA